MKPGGNCIPSKPDLKLSRSGACATAAGRYLQLLMVRGKKEYFNNIVVLSANIY
jgi:hypothetical protein